MKQIYYVIQTLLCGHGSNVIKILSLGLGLTMSILLFSRVAYEQSFDTCFKDYNNLYQVWSVWTIKGETKKPNEHILGPVPGAILENFPEQVEAATSICRYPVLKPLYNGEAKFEEEKIVADSLFFRTFGIEVLSGNPEVDMTQPDVIFLSEQLAQRIFGDENPIDKRLSYNKEYDLTVKGVYANIPNNATVKPEAVVSFPTTIKRRTVNYSWDGGDAWRGYIRFRPDVDTEIINQRMDAMINKYIPKEVQNMAYFTALVKPIRDTYQNYDEVKQMWTIMSVLALSILFIVTLNYVLISVSSLSYRAKAVGVHKCSGANEGTIFSMFLLETLVIILGALLVMGFLLINFCDFFEDTAAFKLSDLFSQQQLWVPLAVVAFLFIVGGILPGRLFARIPVTQVFRRYTEGKKSWKYPLLFVQFAGVAFICGLMCLVIAQYYHVLNKDMGYNPERLAVGTLYGQNSETRQAYYNYFRDLPFVEAVSSTNGNPLDGYDGIGILDESSNETLFFSRISFFMHPDYPEMMGMTFLQGGMGKKWNEVIINEKFAESMHWGKEVIGRQYTAGGQRYTVTGLLKDFQIGNFTSPVLPYISRCDAPFYGDIHLRLKEPFAENFKRLNEEVKNAFPDKAIEFFDYEQKLHQSYDSIRVFKNASMLAAITMFFVMLMGLIGYVTDEVRRRSKEIAIRKVNGAEASSILQMLSKDVVKVALPAVVIGTAFSWYVNNIWVDQFTEQVSIGFFVYFGVIIINLLIIVACVLSKAWKIANENPVNSIKNE